MMPSTMALSAIIHVVTGRLMARRIMDGGPFRDKMLAVHANSGFFARSSG
jgi:hypothetical protein